MKPEVRIVEPQQYSEPQEVNISSSEAYALLAKYGIPKAPQIQPIYNDPNANLTFDEMIAIEDRNRKAAIQQKEMERMVDRNKPTPYSFDRGSIRHHDTQYKSLDDGFGVEVKVVTNMVINKGYVY